MEAKEGAPDPRSKNYYLAAGPELKLTRVSEHLGSLYGAAQIFADSNAFAIAVDIDPETGDHIAKIRIRDQPPASLGLIVSDCIHNMRQALDHAAYSMAVLLSGTNPPPNEGTASFPIHNSAGAFRGSIAAKIGDPTKMPPDLLRALKGLQPYSGEVGKRLAILRDLDDRAKHREVPLCHGVVQVQGGDVEGGAEIKSLAIGPLSEGETEIARFRPTGREAEVGISGQFRISVVFAPNSAAAGQEVAQYVDATRRMIKEVFRTTAPHLRHLSWPESE
jgi:hypothetical protein